MSLVLNSNASAKNYIADSVGIPSHLSGYVLALDFENNQFFKQIGSVKTLFNINDVVSVVDADGPVYSETGDYIFEKNIETIPRITLNQREDAYGLASEGGAQNLYFPSNKPVSKTISLNAVSGARTYSAFYLGSGSVQINCSQSTPSTKQLTNLERGFFNFDVAASVAANFELIITGDVSYLFFGLGKERPVIPTLQKSSSPISQKTEVINLTNNVLQYIKSNSTIVFQCVLNELITGLDKTMLAGLLELSNINGKSISLIHRLLNGYHELVLRSFATSETIQTISSVTKYSTIALSLGVEGLRVAVDGKVSSTLNTDFAGYNPSSVTLGRTPLWTAAAGAAEGIFTKFIVYDRALNSEELSAITKAFQ